MRFVSVMLALLTSPAIAAPIPSIDVAEACGRVVEATFSPEGFIRGMPGMSGTLGIDRRIPAQFRVVIEQMTGISAALAAQANEALSFRGGAPPTRLALQLNSSDPQLLAGVQTLCVRGYRVEGDEGGTWTTFRELIRNPPAK